MSGSCRKYCLWHYVCNSPEEVYWVVATMRLSFREIVRQLDMPDVEKHCNLTMAYWKCGVCRNSGRLKH